MLAVAALCPAQIHQISGQHIRYDTRFLSSDLLEGRGVATRGGDLATEYIATQLALAGAKPAGDHGTYFQKVPLVGVATAPGATLAASGKGKTVNFRWLDEFVGVSELQRPLGEFDAEAIFVGHGITAPEFQWDDYKDVDVRGKILVLFTNEPDSTDPKFFGGKALTYYGRWDYKFEQASRKGALAAIIIHTTPTAGYGWNVVRNSWGGETPYVKLAPGQAALAFTGWITTEAGARLLSLAGRKVDELLTLSNSRDFRPIPLGLHIRGRIPCKVREFETRNVAAIFPGSDPQLTSEAVIFSAHWDHLGIGTPVDGDAIYNGAVDNATGCATILEIARAWAGLGQKPRRSALFLSFAAEEGGLRGSEFYAAHPIVPPGKTALGLNFDGFFPFGRTRDISVGGAERTTAWPLFEEAARRLSLAITPDPHPEQGSFYRSDHFPLALAGIPALSVEMGSQFEGTPAGYGERLFEDYNEKHYHQPSDEYKDDWDFAGIEQIARYGFLVGLNAANLDKLPTWVPGDEFRAAREASGVK